MSRFYSNLVSINVYVSPDLKSDVEHMAKDNGVSLSTFVRLVLEAVTSREIKVNPMSIDPQIIKEAQAQYTVDPKGDARD